MGIADKEDLQQCRDEREALQAELLEINSRIEVLTRNNHRFQLYCNTLNSKGEIGLLASEYLQNVTLYSGERIEVHFCDGMVGN